MILDIYTYTDVCTYMYLHFGSVQSQIGWDFEKLDLVKDVPAYDRSIGLRCLPIKTILMRYFYVFMYICGV